MPNIDRRRFITTSSLAAVGSTLGAQAIALAESKSMLSFGIVADPQYADIDPWNTRFYRQSIPKLTEAVAHFNEKELSFCVNVGDLIDRNWRSYDAIMEPLKRSRQKFHHLLGNHDFELEDERKPAVPGRLGLKQRYYAMTRGQWCFAMLDTNDISLYAYRSSSTQHADAVTELRQLESTGAVNAKSWNGAVSDRQLKWLETTCQTAANAGRRVIVFAHHPI